MMVGEVVAEMILKKIEMDIEAENNIQCWFENLEDW